MNYTKDGAAINVPVVSKEKDQEAESTESDKMVSISEAEYNKLKEINDQYSKLEMLEQYIGENFYQDTKDVDFEDGVYKGLFEALDDPYSTYMTEEEFKSFMEMSEGSYGGIGVVISPGKSGFITVVSPIEDTPGERAGLKTGDEIIKVNGVDFTADQLDEAVKNMKGEPGTDVTITVRRDGEEFDVDITREQIVLKAVKSEVKEDNIGYLRITSFDNHVYDEYKEHLKALMDQGIESLIIDLRSNPGGALDQCVKIADDLLGEQVIVSTKSRDGEVEIEESDAAKLEIPFVVLINEGSASASEIVTGAVKDTNSGTIIGKKSFGKGVVQVVRAMFDGSGFKLTISEYFTPNDVNIHGVGIEPDIEVENPEDSEEDLQLEKAIEVLKGKMK